MSSRLFVCICSARMPCISSRMLRISPRLPRISSRMSLRISTVISEAIDISLKGYQRTMALSFGAAEGCGPERLAARELNLPRGQLRQPRARGQRAEVVGGDQPHQPRQRLQAREARLGDR